MQLFNKNGWLNFLIGLTGFYTVFSLMQVVMGKFGTKVVAATPATNHITGDYYWLISFFVALVLSMLFIVFFCNPRVPLLVFIGVLLGGILVMFFPLYAAIVNLDSNFRKHGTEAVYSLLPHLVILAGSLIALYFAWLSNKFGNSPSAE